MTGNRLSENDGRGGFTDVSVRAGTRVGYWGWASCFADFDNDGNLDIFHVNGFSSGGVEDSEFWADPSRLFMSNRDGTFAERSSERVTTLFPRTRRKRTLDSAGRKPWIYPLDGRTGI